MKEMYGTRLARARALAGLTQAELAQRAELHVVHVSRLESSVRQPSLATAQAIAKALGRPDVALDADPPPTALDTRPAG